MKTPSFGGPRPIVWAVASLSMFVCAGATGAPGDRITRSPFGVNSSRDFAAWYVDLAMRGDGSFDVTSSNDRGIHVRRFNADSSPRGLEFLATDYFALGSDGGPAIATAADGSFVVTWGRSGIVGARGTVLLARLFDPSGAPRGSAFEVSPRDVGASSPPAVAMSFEGRFVVAWAGNDPDSSHQSPFVRLYDADGTPQGPPLRVSEPPPTGMLHVVIPDVTMSATGDVVVAWLQRTDYGPPKIRAQRYAANALPIGTGFTVAKSNRLGDLSPHFFQADTSADGAFVVAYIRQTNAGTADQEGSVFFRRYDALGTPRGREIRASAAPPGRNVKYLGLDVNAGGDFAITWGQAHTRTADRWHVRLYRASGAAVTDPQGLRFTSLRPDYISNPPSIGLDDRGNFLLLWSQNPVGSTSQMPDNWGQLFAGYTDTRPSCARYIATRVGTHGSDTIEGTPADDVIHAFGGNDSVSGLGGSDVICGGAGADLIFGGDGPDEIFGGAGDDVLDGGDDFDFCNGGHQTNADSAVQCEVTRRVP